MKRIMVYAILLMISKAALADGWTPAFTITGVYVAGLNNFQYRVYGVPTQASCTNGPTWAYVNDSDGGSAGQYAAILSAYAEGKSISLNVVTVNGYCHIIELFVTG